MASMPSPAAVAAAEDDLDDRLARGSQPQTGTLGPPRRQEDPDPGVVKHGDPLAEETEDRFAVNGQCGRRRVVEHGAELGRQAHEPAQRGEGVLDHRRSERRMSLPDVGQWQDKARLVSILGEELHAPDVAT